MRCDRLTLGDFRAAGSIFASRSAPRRARFHTRPPAGTSAAKSRSARPAACPCASPIVESRNAPLPASRNALDRHLTVYAFRSLTDHASAHLCPDTLHTAASHARLFHHPAPQIRSRSSTTNRKNPRALLDLHDSLNHRLTHRLKLLHATTRKPKPTRPYHLHTAT